MFQTAERKRKLQSFSTWHCTYKLWELNGLHWQRWKNMWTHKQWSLKKILVLVKSVQNFAICFLFEKVSNFTFRFMAQNCPKLSTMIQHSNMVKYGPRMSNMVLKSKKWFQNAQYGLKWTSMVPNGPKFKVL